MAQLIDLKPDRVYEIIRVVKNPADSGLEPGRVYEIIRVVKNLVEVDPARTGKKPGCNLLTILYFFYQNNVVLICKKNWS
jgi:hypothetical protein